MTNEISRRHCMWLWTKEEKAIHDAVQAVEKLPADVRLTNAVVLLGQAQDAVNEFMESEEGKQYLLSQETPAQ